MIVQLPSLIIVLVLIVTCVIGGRKYMYILISDDDGQPCLSANLEVEYSIKYQTQSMI